MRSLITHTQTPFSYFMSSALLYRRKNWERPQRAKKMEAKRGGRRGKMTPIPASHTFASLVVHYNTSFLNSFHLNLNIIVLNYCQSQKFSCCSSVYSFRRPFLIVFLAGKLLINFFCRKLETLRRASEK